MKHIIPLTVKQQELLDWLRERGGSATLTEFGNMQGKGYSLRCLQRAGRIRFVVAPGQPTTFRPAKVWDAWQKTCRWEIIE